MLFPTFTFASFFLIVYCGHMLLRSRPLAWKIGILAASYVFYGWWNWRLCGLIVLSTVANWAFAKAIAERRGRARKNTVRLAVTANLSMLGFFKYHHFFVDSFNQLFGEAAQLPFVDVLLPVGISFYTFQAISYVVDVHRREITPAPLLDVAVYLAFFPQLVAGPIVRAKEFLPQLRGETGRGDAPTSNVVDVSEAAWLIGRGLFKKVVIATYLADSVVDPVFAAPNSAGRLELFQAMYAYAIQIYADFSGYTDIAIGIALLLGFRFPQNFDAPYRALSIQDFWRRWHITLSNWLRDYLYISLGGNRGGSLRTYRNLMLTMVLGGLWHGAAWTFVVWGAIHGGALAVERALTGRRPETTRASSTTDRNVNISTVLRWLVTFHVVCVAWVVFRAENFAQAGDFLTGLLTAPLTGSLNWLAVLVILAALGAQLIPRDVAAQVRQWSAEVDPLVQGAALGVWIVLVALLGPEGVAPFIYFQF